MEEEKLFFVFEFSDTAEDENILKFVGRINGIPEREVGPEIEICIGIGGFEEEKFEGGKSEEEKFEREKSRS